MLLIDGRHCRECTSFSCTVNFSQPRALRPADVTELFPVPPDPNRFALWLWRFRTELPPVPVPTRTKRNSQHSEASFERELTPQTRRCNRANPCLVAFGASDRLLPSKFTTTRELTVYALCIKRISQKRYLPVLRTRISPVLPLQKPCDTGARANENKPVLPLQSE